jgi:excisionase family DNA binding protein
MKKDKNGARIIATLEELYTVSDVALALKVERKTIYNMISDGRLRAYRVGRVYRISSSDVQAAITAAR